MPTPPPSCRPSRARRRGSPRRASSPRRAGPGRSASASSRRPSSSFVPSSRTTNGTCGLTCSKASMRPLATSSQRVMPPKMLNRTRLDLVVGQDHLDGRDDRVGLRAAAGVEEVRRRAADLGDDVERRHHEPGAVAEDPDVAVELDVRQAALLGHLLLRVLGRRVAQRRVVGMAEQRVVVERDLRVERAQLALGRDDQRVDLDEHRVLGHERLVELGEHRSGRADEVLRDAGVEREAPAVEVLEAEQRVDVQRRDRLRVLLGDRLDVHAALRREHHERRLRGAVEDDRRVVLGLDLRGLLDPDLVDGQAADVHAEDGGRVLARLGLVVRDLDAAELAAPADLHLRLDDARVADRVGRVERLVDGRRRAPLGHRDSVAGEELLALVFE